LLPTFVIGLREGLEAALIVGIIAAFLRQQGRRDLLRSVFIGVGIAVAICLSIGIVLKLVSEDLPQRQQEGMETVIGVIAVGMVTYMVVWMKRHSRDLKGQLEGMTADAIGGSSGSGRAMILMAFLAVLREGIETVVFLLATFNEKHSGPAAPLGAVLGLAVAVVLGYGIYRGGVRLNLSKFFRATGLVLVLVAAGLVVNALHTAHEANWLNAGQSTTVDLTWLVRPGSVQASLLTGMLGVQAKPVLIETVGWLVYLIPVGLYVAWPPGRALARRTTSRLLLTAGVLAGIVSAILFSLVPAGPSAPTAPVSLGGVSASVVQSRVTGADGAAPIHLARTEALVRDGVTLQVWTAHALVDRPGLVRAPYDRIAELNGGRLPIGVHTSSTGSGSLRYTDVTDYSVYVEPRTGRVIEIDVIRKTVATLTDGGRSLPLSDPVSQSSASTPASENTARLHAATHARDVANRRSVLVGFGWFAAAGAVLVLLGGGAVVARTRQGVVATDHTASVENLVRS